MPRIVSTLGHASVRAKACASLAVTVLLLAACCTAHAGAAARVAMPEQLLAWANPANDLGPVDDATPIRLTLMMKPAAERTQAFDALLRGQQDRSSPLYHRWLNANEIGERFGATAQDIASVSAWLSGQGLKVDSVAASRTRLSVSGSAGAVAAAFATSLHRYAVGAEQRIAPAQVPQIGASIASLVASVDGLVVVNAQSAHGSGSARGNVNRASARSTTGTFCNGADCSHYLFPADFSKIYNIDPVYAQGVDGRGQTIAIIGRARVYLPDIENFQKVSGLAVKDPTIVVPPGGIDPGPAPGAGGEASADQREATIDVTRATSIAPGAEIKLVVSANGSGFDGLHAASAYVVDSVPPLAQVMSISFGGCEASFGKGSVDYYDSLFRQAAAEGISVFVISGDSGVAGCNPYNTLPPANQFAGANFICVSSYATCVGGTQFADGAAPSGYWQTSNSGNYASAVGYIPEGAWNEPLSTSGAYQSSASGGGTSSFIPTPYWQTGPGVPGAAGRYTPDIAFSASAKNGYFSCLAADGNACAVDSSGNFSFEFVYGTSAATPDMAGIAALLNQRMGAAQGNLNQRLYALASSSNAAFHDATVASSGIVACDLSEPSACNNSTPGTTSMSNGMRGFAVAPGYDLATGWGSIDVANLLASWDAAVPRVNLNQFGLSGAWYNPATSGQGVLLQTFPDLYGAGQGLMFGGWFTFSTNGASGTRWYTLQGQVSAQNPVASLPIYATYGGNFNTLPKINAVQIGEAVLTFSDCTHGTLAYHFTQDDGAVIDGSMPLARLGSNVACGTAGDTGAALTDATLTGAWYDPQTSGQGLLFAVNPVDNNLFAAWYTFAPNGQAQAGGASQRWYTLQVANFTPGTKSVTNVPIYATSGGVFDNPAKVQRTQVGLANLQFSSCTSLTLSYTFSAGDNQGQTGSASLTHVSSLPGAGCGF